MRSTEALAIRIKDIDFNSGLQSLYVKLLKEFGKVLTLSGLYDKKEGMNRRTISFHSLRRHAKTVISTIR